MPCPNDDCRRVSGRTPNGEKSMIAGASLSANRALPVRSPCTSWRRESSGRQTATRSARCLTCVNDSAVLSPSHAISDRPGIGATGYEIRLGNLGQRSMKELADGNDVAPPTSLMRAFDELPGAPAFAGESAIQSPSREGEPEFVPVDQPEDPQPASRAGLALIDRTEHEFADTPRVAATTRKWHWRTGKAERFYCRTGRRDRHARNLLAEVAPVCASVAPMSMLIPLSGLCRRCGRAVA